MMLQTYRVGSSAGIVMPKRCGRAHDAACRSGFRTLFGRSTFTMMSIPAASQRKRETSMNITTRAKDITLRPGIAWPQIASEPSTVASTYAGYVAPLAAIGPVALFVGLSIVGIGIPFIGTYRMPVVQGVVQAAITFIVVLAGLFLFALIANALAPSFGGRKDVAAAVKLVGYSMTPALLAGVLYIFPPLAILGIFAAFYGLYLFYRGAPILMNLAADKVVPYTLVTIVCSIFAGIVLQITLALTLGVAGLGAGALAFGSHRPALSQADGESQGKAVIANIVGQAMGGKTGDSEAAQKMIDSATQAAKQAETAEKTGDSAAQAAAGLGILKSIASGGAENVHPIPREELKALLPQDVVGLSRASGDSRTSSTFGMSASSATATYGDASGTGGNVQLDVLDFGGAKGLGMIARMGANIVPDEETDAGYTKKVDVGGRTVHVEWKNASKHAELLEMIDDRVAVGVTSNGIDVDTAMKALASVDVGRFEALEKVSR